MFDAAVNFLKGEVYRWGFASSSWYIGITNNPNNALFVRHNVQRVDPWAHFRCLNAQIARKVEEYLLLTLGAQGDTGGGDDDSIYVYAYKITNRTNEN